MCNIYDQKCQVLVTTRAASNVESKAFPNPIRMFYKTKADSKNFIEYLFGCTLFLSTGNNK